MRIVSRILVLLTLLAAAAPARALDTLEDVHCVCADGALNAGDFVSCVAHFTRRLEASGRMTREERSAAVSGASSVDFALLSRTCPPAFGGGSAEQGWGTSVAVSTPNPPSSPAFETAVDVRVKLFNDTTCVICPDVEMIMPVQPDGSVCLYEARILRGGLVVRRELLECELGGDPVLTIPKGARVEREFTLPLVALDADPATGLADGTRLTGVLEVEILWTGEGPEFDGTVEGFGREPIARIPLRTR